MRNLSVLILAVISLLGFILFQHMSRAESRILSTWRGPMSAGEALAASMSDVQSLTGMAEPQGRGLDAPLVTDR
jgi:hypothetical protein